MGEHRQWYLVTYDVRDPKRLRRVHKWLRGYGEPVQYSVFRLRASNTMIERLHWELEEIMAGTDDALLIIPLCRTCSSNIRSRTYKGWGMGPSYVVVESEDDPE